MSQASSVRFLPSILSARMIFVFSLAIFLVHGTPGKAQLLMSGPPPAFPAHLGTKAEVVMPAERFDCPGVDAGHETIDVPDAPLRFFESSGRHRLGVAAHYANYLLDTTNPGHIRHFNCASALSTAPKSDPAAAAGRDWLVATTRLKDGRMFGLIHDEYWGSAYNADCRRRLGNQPLWASVCTYINLYGAISNDGGYHFERLPFPAGEVASRQEKFALDMDRAGVRDPSNILHIRATGYYYLIAYVDGYGAQPPGSCLFRTRNPGQGAWNVWNGKNFARKMRRPYGRDGLAQTICAPVFPVWITSILAVSGDCGYVALGRDDVVGGIFYATSMDLIHWSHPEILRAGTDMNHWKVGQPEPWAFPSLIDPGQGPNFDVVGGKPFVYAFRVRLGIRGPKTRERDIVRTPLRLDLPAKCIRTH